MKRLLSIILLATIFLTSVSCTNNDRQSPNELNSNNSTDTIETNATVNSAPKHYEIVLDETNYHSYLTYSTTNKTVGAGTAHAKTYLNYFHAISGVLRFAYYENVVVVFDVIYQREDATYTGEYSVVLNAAGDAEFCSQDNDILETIGCPTEKFTLYTKVTFTIKGVSGKVIFTA